MDKLFLNINVTVTCLRIGVNLYQYLGLDYLLKHLSDLITYQHLHFLLCSLVIRPGPLDARRILEHEGPFKLSDTSIGRICHLIQCPVFKPRGEKDFFFP